MTTQTEPAPEELDPLRARLAAYVKAPDRDADHVQACLDEAIELVATAAAATWKTVPDDILDRAAIEVAADLYHRRQTRMGVAGFADTDLNPVRVTRDPLAAARPILAPYLAGGFG